MRKMKKRIIAGPILLFVWAITCSNGGNPAHYLSLSRFTDPLDLSPMLNKLPENALEICEIAERQMVHHNLLVYHDIPYRRNEGIPPRMTRLLGMVRRTEPHNIYGERPVEQRIVGSCVVESHFLTGLLRHKNIPARLRVGYFQDIIKDPEHFANFWERTFRGRRVLGNLLDENPAEWQEWVNSFTSKQIKDNHYIEHWVCEYWDDEMKEWRILDANRTFLKASCNIEIGYLVPDEHYELAFEAWKKMRRTEDFNPDQYREDDEDGRSHIRKSMIWDFFSLLNHDFAGMDSPTYDAWEFVTRKRYDELSTDEIEELDRLADLLSQDPTKEELVSFYRNSKTLKIESAETDPYSFVYDQSK